MNTLLGRIAAGKIAQLSLLLDVLVLAMAVFAAGQVRLRGSVPPALLAFAAGAVVLWLLGALALRHYDPWAPERQYFDDAALVSVLVLAVTSAAATAELLVDASAGVPSAASLLLVLWPTALATRAAVFRGFSHREGPLDEVLVVGVGPMGRATAVDVDRGRRHLLGYVRFADEAKPAALQGKVLGDVADLEQLLRAIPVSEVYLASTSLEHAEPLQGAVKVCERLGVPFALPVNFLRLDRARPLDSHGVGDGYVHYQSGAFKPTPMALKRVFDIAVSGAALWVLMPLLLGVAALVKLTSRGPVLFRQKRVGLHGKPFSMLKFRTMVENAEALKASLATQNEMDGPVFKMKRDPRITPIGRFLRKFSIDELPQLLNVLRGDMSVVGPRPPVPSEVAKYEGWQRRRLSVRPGLTCVWQVSGRNEISFEQWMYMDLQYIDHWSFSSDLALIFRTVPVVLLGRGAS
jgi:exopolysaccharide biosynthesis polyprenyl glycosylphosphotransferase